MSNNSNYAYVIRVSKKNKDLIEGYIKETMIKEHPELEGSNISNNQAISVLLNQYAILRDDLG